MSAWHDLYRFWVSEQQLAGNVISDVAIGAGAYLIGKFKVAPWIKQRHEEHLEQKERQHQEFLAAHQELLDSHQRLYEQHERHHHELLKATHDKAADQHQPDP